MFSSVEIVFEKNKQRITYRNGDVEETIRLRDVVEASHDAALNAIDKKEIDDKTDESIAEICRLVSENNMMKEEEKSRKVLELKTDEGIAQVRAMVTDRLVAAKKKKMGEETFAAILGGLADDMLRHYDENKDKIGGAK